MTATTSEFNKQLLTGSHKTTESTKSEQFLSYIYSKNNSPEANVKSAIAKIEENLKDMGFQEEQQEKPVVILKEPEPIKENYKLLQQWEGVILKVYDDYFSCRLHDMSSKSPDEEAEIAFDEISERDMHLVKPGAFFYWSIGRHEAKSGQQTKSSLIIFRRVPAWSEKEIERSRKRSENICAILGWDINNLDSHERTKSEGL